jgi:hypothetical protein
MFVGHFAPALVAATHKKAPSLPVLFVAAQFVDWVFFGFVLIGVERMRIVPGFTEVNPFDLYDMPWTHSLAGALGWSLVFGFAVWLVAKGWAAAWIAAAVVVSHWFLDLLVHSPDLTIAGGSTKLGLGLWNHPAIEMPLEIGITLAAILVYARVARPRMLPLAVLVVVLLALQAIDWFGAKPAEPDVSMTFLGWLGYAVATLAAWWVWKGRSQKEI